MRHPNVSLLVVGDGGAAAEPTHASDDGEKKVYEGTVGNACTRHILIIPGTQKQKNQQNPLETSEGKNKKMKTPWVSQAAVALAT